MDIIKQLFGPDEVLVNQYLDSIKEHIHLGKKDTADIIDDFKKLILFYTYSGMTAQEAIERIGENPLGNFYQTVNDEWYRLDSAARVYPLCLTRSSMAVYRVSVYLKQSVIPCILQVALLSTMKRFPTFATTVRKGFFWHFLDASRRRFTVKEEKTMPCMPIDVSGSAAPGFRVQYYKHRISLEASHILTDGAGAMTFLKTLLREYLRLTGNEIPYDADIFNLSDEPEEAERMDDFPMADKSEESGGLLSMPAAQLKGKRTVAQPARVLHFKISSSELRAISKQKGTTVTGFLVSALFIASAASLKKKKPGSRIQIQVPANMRSYYPSKTLFNFSMFALLKLSYEQVTSLEEIIPVVEKQLKEKTSKTALDKTIKMTNSLVSNPVLRFTPLALKRLVFQNAVNPFKDRTQTTTLSNIGIVKNDFFGHVDSFEAILGPNGVNRAALAMISYEDNAILSVTKSTLNDSFENSLYEVLASAGVHMEIEEVHI